MVYSVHRCSWFPLHNVVSGDSADFGHQLVYFQWHTSKKTQWGWNQVKSSVCAFKGLGVMTGGGLSQTSLFQQVLP